MVIDGFAPLPFQTHKTVLGFVYLLSTSHDVPSDVQCNRGSPPHPFVVIRPPTSLLFLLVSGCLVGTQLYTLHLVPPCGFISIVQVIGQPPTPEPSKVPSIKRGTMGGGGCVIWFLGQSSLLFLLSLSTMINISTPAPRFSTTIDSCKCFVSIV